MTLDQTKTKEVQSDREIAIGSAVDSIKEKFGEGAIMRLGEVKKVDIDAIPTGSV